MSLLKGEKTASKTLKRRRDESTPHDYPGSSTEKDTPSDEECDKSVARNASMISDKIPSNVFTVPEYEARPRKRSRTSQDLVGILNQCPTPLRSVTSSTDSPKYTRAKQHGNGCPMKTTTLDLTILPNDHSPKDRLNDIRSSFEGWLQPQASKTGVHAQGNSGPTFQLTSEMSVVASTPERKPKVKWKESGISANPTIRYGNPRGKGYRCKWHKCNEKLDLLSHLRWHVFQNHQPIDNSYQSSKYTCRWGGCSRLDTPIFPTKELWMDHLDVSHNLARLRTPCKAKKGHEKKSKLDSQMSQESSFRPPIDGTHRTEESGSDQPQLPAGTQADPITLSSQETSTCAVALSQMIYPDDHHQGSSPNNATAHESQESHLSISTTAFESQSSHPLHTKNRAEDLYAGREITTSKINHRKEAYRAAKRIGGLEWADMGLVSSSVGHGVLEEEF